MTLQRLQRLPVMMLLLAATSFGGILGCKRHTVHHRPAGSDRLPLSTDSKIEIQYGTDREPQGVVEAVRQFGDTSVALTYGVCHVSIPKTHKPGCLEEPRWWWQETATGKHVDLFGCQMLPPDSIRDAHRSPARSVWFLPRKRVRNADAVVGSKGVEGQFAGVGRLLDVLECRCNDHAPDFRFFLTRRMGDLCLHENSLWMATLDRQPPRLAVSWGYRRPDGCPEHGEAAKVVRRERGPNVPSLNLLLTGKSMRLHPQRSTEGVF